MTGTTQPIPDTRIYRAMKAGHLTRTGHELTGHLDTRQGFAELVRSCCPDETARILAEHGDAVKIAVYAIHGAHQAYREARAAAEAPWIAAGRPAGPVWDETARIINAAAAERRRTLAGILSAYDVSKDPGTSDNYEISTARGYLTPRPAFLGSVA